MTTQPVPIRARSARWLLLVSRAAFAVAAFLAAVTAYWQGGILSRWPVAWLHLAHDVYPVGVLVLLPVLAAVAWLLGRLLEQPRRRWRWGPWPVALPVLGFGAIVLVRIWPIQDSSAAVIAVLGVSFFWSIYLYVLQDWPTPWAVGTLAGVVLVQGSVASVQFLRQSSVGLGLLGEFRLNPAMPGIAVIESGGQRWLRAYGLTSHPNALGGYLALGLLVCLGALLSSRGWRRWALAACLVPGALGLFFSFSRAAWLATLAGLAYLLVVHRPWTRVRWSAAARCWLLFGAVLLLMAGIVLGALYGDLVLTRLLCLDSPLEYRSLHDRLTDIAQAWDLIRAAPFTGVGTGHYRETLWAQAGATPPPGFRMVHSVLFLAAAELGLPGAVLWFWLLLAPPLVLLLRSRRGAASAGRAGWTAAFVGAAVISLLDYYLYMPATWWPAFFMGIFTGIWARDDPDGPGGNKEPPPGTSQEA
jgi:O-antigen ligase